jgi:hypothetical protein
MIPKVPAGKVQSGLLVVDFEIGRRGIDANAAQDRAEPNGPDERHNATHVKTHTNGGLAETQPQPPVAV